MRAIPSFALLIRLDGRCPAQIAACALEHLVRLPCPGIEVALYAPPPLMGVKLVKHPRAREALRNDAGVMDAVRFKMRTGHEHGAGFTLYAVIGRLVP